MPMRRIGIPLLFFVSLLLLQACGGGGATSTTPPLTTDAARVVTLAEISTKAEVLSVENFDTLAPALISALQTRPDVAEAKLSEDPTDNSIQVWLKDGRSLVIARNRPEGPDSSAATLAPMRSRGAGLALPNGVEAKTFFSFSDPKFTNSSAATLAQLRGAGYTTASAPLAGTVEDYKGLNSAGVLMVESHGVTVEVDRVTRTWGVGIMTATTPTAELDALYKEDLDSGNLAYLDAGGADGQKYMVTAKFVKKYVKLAPQAFVFLNTCHSLDKKDLGQAFLDAGAGAVFGWSKPVEDKHAVQTAYFLFDKLLGLNTLLPGLEEPAIAPQDWDAVLKAAESTFRPGSGTWHLSRSLNGSTKLLVLSKPNDLGTIRPSIESALAVPASNTLTLAGKFGFVQGTAVGNPGSTKVTLPVTKWGPMSVSVELKEGVSTVQLSVGDVKSQVFNLKKTYTIAGPLRTPFEVRDQIEIKLGSTVLFTGGGANIAPIVFDAIPGQKLRLKISTTKAQGGTSQLFMIPPTGAPYVIRPQAFDLLANPSTGVISDLEYSLEP